MKPTLYYALVAGLLWLRPRDRPAAASARARLRPIPALMSDGWTQADPQLGDLLRLHGRAQRGRVAQQLDQFLDRLQAVGCAAPHLPVRRRQHPDAASPWPDEGRRCARRTGTDRMSDPILSIRGLRKEYGTGVDALKSVDLDIRRGEIFALLGPNGAGKTTLINIVCGIVTPSERRGAGRRQELAVATIAMRASGSAWFRRSLRPRRSRPVWNTVTFSRGLFGKPRNDAYIEELLKTPVAVGQAQDDHDAPIGRHEAPGDDRQGAEPRARHPVPRRADRRRRRRASPRHVGPGAQAPRRRHHDHPHHPLYRGSRGDGRPRRRHQQRRTDRGRREDVADGEDGQEDARHHACRTAGSRFRPSFRSGTSSSNDDGHLSATNSTATPNAPASPR